MKLDIPKNNQKLLLILSIDKLLLEKEFIFSSVVNTILNKLSSVPADEAGDKPQNLYLDFVRDVRKALSILHASVLDDGTNLMEGLFDDTNVKTPSTSLVSKAKLVLTNMGYIPEDLDELDSLFTSYLYTIRKILNLSLYYKYLNTDAASTQIGFSAVSSLVDSWAGLDILEEVPEDVLKFCSPLYNYLEQGQFKVIIEQMMPIGVYFEKVSAVITQSDNPQTFYIGKEDYYSYAKTILIYNPDNKIDQITDFDESLDLDNVTLTFFPEQTSLPDAPTGYVVDFVAIRKPKAFDKALSNVLTLPTGFVFHEASVKIPCDMVCFKSDKIIASYRFPYQLLPLAVLQAKYEKIPEDDTFHRVGDIIPFGDGGIVNTKCVLGTYCEVEVEFSPTAFLYPNNLVVTSAVKDYVNIEPGKNVLGIELKNGNRYFIEFVPGKKSTLELAYWIDVKVPELRAYLDKENRLVIKSVSTIPFRVMSEYEGSTINTSLGWSKVGCLQEDNSCNYVVHLFFIALIRGDDLIADNLQILLSAYLKGFEEKVFTITKESAKDLRLNKPYSLRFGVNADVFIPQYMYVSSIDYKLPVDPASISSKYCDPQTPTCYSEKFFPNKPYTRKYSDGFTDNPSQMTEIHVDTPFWEGMPVFGTDFIWRLSDLYRVIHKLKLYPTKSLFEIETFSEYLIAPPSTKIRQVTIRFKETNITPQKRVLVFKLAKFLNTTDRQVNYYAIELPVGRFTPQSLFNAISQNQSGYSLTSAKLVDGKVTDVTGQVTPISLSFVNDGLVFSVPEDWDRLWLLSEKEGSTANYILGLPECGFYGDVYDIDIAFLYEFKLYAAIYKSPLVDGIYRFKAKPIILARTVLKETTLPCGEKCYTAVSEQESLFYDYIVSTYEDECIDNNIPPLPIEHCVDLPEDTTSLDFEPSKASLLPANKPTTKEEEQEVVTEVAYGPLAKVMYCNLVYKEYPVIIPPDDVKKPVVEIDPPDKPGPVYPPDIPQIILPDDKIIIKPKPVPPEPKPIPVTVIVPHPVPPPDVISGVDFTFSCSPNEGEELRKVFIPYFIDNSFPKEMIEKIKNTIVNNNAYVLVYKKRFPMEIYMGLSANVPMKIYMVVSSRDYIIVIFKATCESSPYLVCFPQCIDKTSMLRIETVTNNYDITFEPSTTCESAFEIVKRSLPYSFEVTKFSNRCLQISNRLSTIISVSGDFDIQKLAEGTGKGSFKATLKLLNITKEV